MSIRKSAFRTSKTMSIVICFTLLFGLLASALAPAAEAAKTVRLGIIKELSGTVSVKKSGAAKSFKAFKNMSLNQGDYITTGDKSKLVIQLASGDKSDDEITIGSNADLYISDLADKDGSKKSSVKMWAGSMAAKVRSISNADDEFEVETPTAVMAVRGTVLTTTVDPLTGNTSIMVAAGVVHARTTTPTSQGSGQNGQPSQNNGYNIYPTQEISFINDRNSGDIVSNRTIVDPAQFASQVDPSIIRALIQTYQEIEQENSQYIDNLKKLLVDNGMYTQDDEIFKEQDLNRFQENLANVISLIAKAARDSNKIQTNELQQLIDQANRNVEHKLNLDNPKPLQLTPDEEKKRKEKEDLLKKQQKQQEQEQDQAKKLKDKNKGLIDQIEKRKKEIEEAIKKAQQEAAKKAEEALLSKMTPAEREQYLKNKNNNNPSPQPPTTNPGSSGGTVNPNPNPDPGTPPVLPKAAIKLQTGSLIGMDVKFNNFTKGTVNSVTYDNSFYGIELHFIVDRGLDFNSEASFHFLNDKLNNEEVVQSVISYREDYIDENKKELTIVIMKYGDSANVELNDKLMTLVFYPNFGLLPEGGQSGLGIKLAEALVVNKNGVAIPVDVDQQQYYIQLPVLD